MKHHLLCEWKTVTACALACVAATASAERQVIATLDNEPSDYTIEREYQKHHRRYPDLRAVAPERSGAFLAHEGVVYREVDDQALRLDLFLPTSHDTSHPLVVLIHGGGWRSGDKRHMVPFAKSLAEHGYAAAAVEYRTSRQALYPAGLGDCESAIRWLLDRAAEYHIDPKRIAIGGASSGAHMATLLGNQLGRHHPEVPVGVIVNLDGIVETTSESLRGDEDRPGKISYLALWLGGRYSEYPDLWRAASPMTYVGEDTPATLFLNSSQPRFHAGRDAYIEVLRGHGVATEVVEYPDTPHTFWLFHPWHDRAREAMVTFLHEQLKPE